VEINYKGKVTKVNIASRYESVGGDGGNNAKTLFMSGGVATNNATHALN